MVATAPAEAGTPRVPSLVLKERARVRSLSFSFLLFFLSRTFPPRERRLVGTVLQNQKTKPNCLSSLPHSSYFLYSFSPFLSSTLSFETRQLPRASRRATPSLRPFLSLASSVSTSVSRFLFLSLFLSSKFFEVFFEEDVSRCTLTISESKRVRFFLARETIVPLTFFQSRRLKRP